MNQPKNIIHKDVVPDEMIYNRILENIILPAGGFITGSNLMAELKKWRKIVRMNSSELKKLQRKNLKDQLEHCKKNIPFYKAINLPETEDPFELIRQFPIMTKQLIKDNLDGLVLGDRSKLIKESSSGSSGIQGSVYMTKSEENVNRAIQLLWWEWAGYKIGDKIIQTGMTIDRNYEKYIKDILLRTDYYIAFGLDEEKIKKALVQHKNNPRKMLLGYASSLYVFAKVARDLKIEVHFESVVSWGDKMFEHYRRLIESQFKTKVYDTYACTEGFMIAAQCEKGKYHIMSPQIFLELLDDNGKPVNEGEAGNVVVTRIDNRAMPLVRYSLGDLVVKEDEGISCSCGRGLPLLKSIIGRDTDIVRTTSGKHLIVHFFTAIFEHIPEVSQFRIIQRKYDSIEVEYIRGENFKKEILQKINDQILDHLNDHLEIIFREVQHIPPAKSGKPQIIFSLLDEKNKDEIISFLH